MGSKETGQIVRGFTCPEDISIFFEGCYFKVEKSGTCIVYYSGTSIIPTKEQVEAYEFGNTGSIFNQLNTPGGQNG